MVSKISHKTNKPYSSYSSYSNYSDYSLYRRHWPLFSLFIFSFFILFALSSCGGKTKKGTTADTIALSPAPTFVADSAMAYVQAQCAFGPRVPGSAAHEECAAWIGEKFQQLGAQVSEQRTTLNGYDGQPMACRNIVAQTNPDALDRVLITAHWDSRAWADNDPDAANHHTPVMAANDGASGVAVMLEMARVILQTGLSYGIDFVCFDLEDQGTPQWAESDGESYWCLGSTYWAQVAAAEGYRARYGVNLDMVGGRGARFLMEGFSMQYGRPIVGMVWHLGIQLGFGQYFVPKDGGYITDDHLPVNRIAHIPCIDIIPSVDSAASSFGETWHTTADTPENIDPEALRAVGQTLIQLIYNDN